MLAGLGGVGALVVTFESAPVVAAAPRADVPTEEWMLATQGALAAIGDAERRVRDEVARSS